MKKLLFSSIVLFIFSISLTLFQISCSKQSNAQNRATSSQQLNKILYCIPNSALSTEEIWMANYDGTNPTRVALSLPANFHIDITYPAEAVRLSPDGLTLFFEGAYNNAGANGSSIYACNIDGSNLRLVIQNTSYPITIRFEGVY